MIHRRVGLGLTTKTLGITLVILALIVSVTLTLSHAFERLHTQTRTLATTEMEQLMTSVRLVQQSESLGYLGMRLASADSHASRRRALVDLTDLTTWVNQLTDRLAQMSNTPELILQVKDTQQQLQHNITALNDRVAERIDGNQAAGLLRQIDVLSHNNRELSGQLAVLVGYFSATMRQQMVNQSERLADDIHTQQRNLIALSLLVLVFTLLAGIYFEFRIVRRILHLQRNVSSPVVDIEAFDTRGGDEISRLAKTVRSYVQRIQSHELQMQKAHQEMTYLAEHDALTGLANRRHFHAAVERLLCLGHQLLCVSIGDIDHFKKINDHYGHAAGDKVLVELSRLLEQGLRESDILARFGGEEFALVLPVNAPDDGEQVLEKLRARIARQPMMLGSSSPVQVSMSFGLALIDTTPLGDTATQEQLEALLERALRAADRALYTAKRSGRNQLALASEDIHVQAV